MMMSDVALLAVMNVKGKEVSFAMSTHWFAAKNGKKNHNDKKEMKKVIVLDLVLLKRTLTHLEHRIKRTNTIIIQ